MFIHIKTVQSVHLFGREFEIDYIEIGDYTFFRIGFRKGDESRARALASVSWLLDVTRGLKRVEDWIPSEASL